MVDIIYDGQCGFCQRAMRVAARLDSRHQLRFHDATERDAVLRQFPELAQADLADAMFAIDARRRLFRGFFAFRRIVRATPRAWLLLPLFYVPGSGLIGPRVYAWVARNRRRFGCESEVCEVPPRPVK